MSKTRLLRAATLGVAGLLLTGCGSASPGVAARIGDQELTVRQVDSATAHYCTALGTLESEVPMSYVRQFVIQLLALRSQADQIADDYGVEAGRDLPQRRRTARGHGREQAGGGPRGLRRALVDDRPTPRTSSTRSAGSCSTSRASPTRPSRRSRRPGVDVFNQWPDANGLEVDARYGLKNVDGTLTPVDTNTSVAVGETAMAGLATEPDTAYAQSLPAQHRCG